jgi:hypothetical protein
MGALFDFFNLFAECAEFAEFAEFVSVLPMYLDKNVNIACPNHKQERFNLKNATLLGMSSWFSCLTTKKC